MGALLGIEVGREERQRTVEAVDTLFALVVDEFGVAAQFLQIGDGGQRRDADLGALLLRFCANPTRPETSFNIAPSESFFFPQGSLSIVIFDERIEIIQK